MPRSRCCELLARRRELHRVRELGASFFGRSYSQEQVALGFEGISLGCVTRLALTFLELKSGDTPTLREHDIVAPDPVELGAGRRASSAWGESRPTKKLAGNFRSTATQQRSP